MKKTFSLILSLLLILSAFTITAYAQDSAETGRVISEEVEYFEDGSCMVITLVEETEGILARAASTKNYTKNALYKDSDGNTLWAAKLTAKFSYTGSSATCTSSTAAYSISKSTWKCTKNTASKSGRTATGNFTFKHYLGIVPIKTVNKTITISCSNSGVIS